MELSSHPLEEVAAEAVVVIRALIQQRPNEHCGVIVRLVRRLDQLRAPPARAAVVWLAAWEHSGPGEPPPPEGSDAAKLLKIAPEAMRQARSPSRPPTLCLVAPFAAPRPPWQRARTGVDV